MSSRGTIAAVLLGILLTTTVAAGSVVFAAQGTVLSADFVTQTIEEEGGYEVLADELQAVVENATGGSLQNASDAQFAQLIDGDPLEQAITPAYIQSQVEPNVETFYAYLHGETDVLNLSLDTRPIADNVGDVVADSISESNVTELVDAVPGDPFADVPINRSTIAALNESPESYRDVKDRLRSEIRQRIVDVAVDEAFESLSNDRLLALVIPDYNPDDYTEQEKEQMVQDRESEIRQALRERIKSERDDEIDAAVQTELENLRERTAQNQPTAEQLGNASIATAAGDLQMAVVTGMTTDQTYEEYRANVSSAKTDLGEAVGTYVEAQIAQQAGVVDLNEQLNIPERGEFTGPRTIVGYLDLLVFVLPLLGLVLVGGVYAATRSPARTAGTLGWSFLIAGVASFAAASVIGGRLEEMVQLEGEGAAEMQPVVQGIIDQVVGAITFQSLLVAVVGVLLVVGALAVKFGARERFHEILGGAEDSGQAGGRGPGGGPPGGGGATGGHGGGQPPAGQPPAGGPRDGPTGSDGSPASGPAEGDQSTEGGQPPDEGGAGAGEGPDDAPGADDASGAGNRMHEPGSSGTDPLADAAGGGDGADAGDETDASDEN